MAKSLVVVVLLVLAAVLAAHLYFTDARLTELARQSLAHKWPHLPTAVGSVHRLGFGLEVRDVRLGAPQGFAHDIVDVTQLRAQLRWGPLLWHRQVWIDAIDIDVKDAALEETAAGRNIDALIAPTPSSAPPTHFEAPQLPLRVTVNMARLSVHTLRYTAPHRDALLTDVVVEGSLDGVDDKLDASITWRLGAQAPGAASTLRIQSGVADAVAVLIEQRSQLTATVHDWQLGSITWQYDAQVQVPSLKIPSLSVHGDTHVELDARAGRVALSPVVWRLGEVGTLSLDAALETLWDAPKAHVRRADGVLHLDRLMPYVAALVPKAHLTGAVYVEVPPLSAPLSAQAANTDAAVNVRVERVNVSLAPGNPNATPFFIEAFNAIAQVGVVDQNATANGIFWIARLGQGDNTVTALRGTGLVTTDLQARGLGPDSALTVDAQLEIEKAAAASAAVRAAYAHLHTTVPTSFLRGESSATPLLYKLDGSWRDATGHSAHALGGTVTLQGHISDPHGRRAQAQAQLGITRIQLDRPNAPRWSLPTLRIEATVARDDDTLTLSDGRIAVGDGLHCVAHGSVDGATTDAPRLRDVTMHLFPTDLQTLAALSPPPVDLQTLRGSLEIKLASAGVLPYVAWATRLTPPPTPSLNTPDTDAAWAVSLQAYAAWVRAWARSFDAGLGFAATADVALTDVSYSTQTLSVNGLTLHASGGLSAQGPFLQAHLRVPEAPAPTAAPLRGVDVTWAVGYADGVLKTTAQGHLDVVSLPGQPTPVEGVSLVAAAHYSLDGDALLETLDVSARNRGLSMHADGAWTRPLAAIASRAWLRPGLEGVQLSANMRTAFTSDTPLVLTQSGLTLSGQASFVTHISQNAGLLSTTGEVRFADLTGAIGTNSFAGLQGNLPYDVRLLWGQSPHAAPLLRNLPWGGGTVSWVSDADDIRNRPARPVYYDRLRPYRQDRGLRAQQIKSGPYEVRDVGLEGRIENGMMLADWMGLNILGGDAVGNLALQLGPDSTLRGDMTFKASNIDASNFVALHLLPGTASQLSADARLGFLAGASNRDLTLNMNVTKIGSQALDRFLQLLDPDGHDAKLAQTRSNLSLIRISELAMWIRYENLNIDLEYLPLVRLPFTRIGYRPIDREMLRRYALGDFFDVYLQPLEDRWLAPWLGWNRAP